MKWLANVLTRLAWWVEDLAEFIDYDEAARVAEQLYEQRRVASEEEGEECEGRCLGVDEDIGEGSSHQTSVDKEPEEHVPPDRNIEMMILSILECADAEHDPLGIRLGKISGTAGRLLAAWRVREKEHPYGYRPNAEMKLAPHSDPRGCIVGGWHPKRVELTACERCGIAVCLGHTGVHWELVHSRS